MLEPTDSDVRERWKVLWDTSPQRSPFSQLEYVRATADAAGLHVGFHFITSGGRDTAGAAVTWRRFGPYREVIVPPFTPFSALLLKTSPPEADVHSASDPISSLLAELDNRYHAVRLHLHPTMTDVRPAQWRGWSAEPLYTYHKAASDCTPETWSNSTARNFRASRHEYEVVEGPEAADAAVKLAATSYDRSDRALPLHELTLRTLVNRLIEAGIATSFAVRRKQSGDIDAGVVAVHADRSAYYWIAGSRPGDGMTVLIGMMLPRLVRTGIETFDFVGANTPSIAEFKRRFGADLVPYYRLVRISRLELRLLHIIRKL